MNKSVNIQRGNSAFSTFGGQRCNFHSLDFGQLVPCMCDEVLERDSWRFNIKNSLEIAPLAVKTRNDVFYNQAAFFVSCTQLDKEFKDIRAMKNHHYGITTNSPLTFRYSAVLNYILNDVRVNWDASALTIKHLANTPSTYKGLVEIPSSTVTYTAVSGGSDYNELLSNIKSYAQSNGKDINVVLAFLDDGLYKFIFLPLTLTKKGQALRKVFDGLGYKMPMVFFDHTDIVTNPFPQTFTTKAIQITNPAATPTSYEFHSVLGYE